MIMIVVSLGAYLIYGPSGCMNDPHEFGLAFGLLFFAVKWGWKILKALNDLIDPYLPNHDPEPKPPPPDDF
jgi:hypothetical protein